MLVKWVKAIDSLLGRRYVLKLISARKKLFELTPGVRSRIWLVMDGVYQKKKKNEAQILNSSQIFRN